MLGIIIMLYNKEIQSTYPFTVFSENLNNNLNILIQLHHVK